VIQIFLTLFFFAVKVTLPEGVQGGQTIHVQAPDGRLNEIVVPQGFGPGSTFTVEFVDEDPNFKKQPAPTPTYQQNAPTDQKAYMMAAAVPADNGHDDGFATGFHNPGFVPPPAPAPASYVGGEQEIDLNSYPAASDAKPVYSSGPSYPSAKPY
jgi:hypothetical protein